ncbi:MAG: hypothetical protein R3E31_06850 [Chloroflexota bacterium]
MTKRHARWRGSSWHIKIPISRQLCSFPEGHISDTGELMLFRYGAFEVAVSGGLPVMPCVFTYDPLPVVGWTDESLLTALACRHLWRADLSRLQVLRVVQPCPDDDAKQLARNAWRDDGRSPLQRPRG